MRPGFHWGNACTVPRANTFNSPFVVGVTGHRNLAADQLPQLRASVAAFFRLLGECMPETQLRLVVGMAAGADLLSAEVALELGVQVEALLPMPLAEYAADFSADDLARLHALLAHPGVQVRQLASAAAASGTAAGIAYSARDARYVLLSETLLRRSSVLLALWDGAASALPAGTADTVLRFLGVRSDTLRSEPTLQFTPAAVDMDAAERLVYWIPAARTSGHAIAGPGATCWLRGLGDDSLETQPAMPAQLAIQLRLLDHYNRDYDDLRASGQLPEPAPLAAGLPPGTPLADDPMLAAIDSQYRKADSLAVHYQLRSDRLFTLFGVMTFTMGLAYLIYEKLTDSRLLLLGYLAILLGSLGLYYVLGRHRWFAKHLTYRALAETMRVKFYLRLAGVDGRVDALGVLALSGIDRFQGFNWISYVLCSVQPTCFEPPAGHEAAQRQRALAVQPAWIDDQHAYFSRKVRQLERSSRRVHRLRNFIFVLIVVVIVVLFVFGHELHEHSMGHGVSLHNLLTFLTGFSAVLLGAWELHQNKMATRELLWQYRNQRKHFGHARERLARAQPGPQRDAVVAELGRDSLMESYLWTIHRYHREHEPPAAGGG
jgi:hypothetical protein